MSDGRRFEDPAAGPITQVPITQVPGTLAMAQGMTLRAHRPVATA